MRNLKKIFKFFLLNKQIISYLLSYVIILFISSYHLATTIIINLILIINFIKLVLNNCNEHKSKNLNYFVYSLLIGNYFIFQTMVYSYKEILGWELTLLILFNLLFIYYLYYLKNFKKNNNNNDLIQYNKFIQISSSSKSMNHKQFFCRL